ncbi:MAG: fibronectin type III domain-containing protein [Candidatus Firestonebacteria bacterium]|nr:fibronectin type III domain-containing protein [Candidatus Firestonebacteria bacterium]
MILDVDYYFYITAVDKSNNESEPSNLAVSKPYGDITPPLKPTGLLASPGSKKGEIDLSWTANTEEDFLSYGIYFAIQGGTDFVFIESSLLNSYIARDLKPGYGYYFRITAVDKSNNESEYSDTVFSLAKGDKVAPLAPAGLTASAGGSKGKINLSWKANTESDLEKYRIYQSANGSVYGEIDNVKGTPPDTTYIVSGLTTGTYYFYKISAIDDSGNESERSNRTGADAP